MPVSFAFETSLQQGGADKCTHREAGFDMTELSSVALYRLHSLEKFEALEKTLSGSKLSLPKAVNGSMGQDPAVLCLAPGDWLIFSEYLSCALLEEQLADAVDAEMTSLINVSSAMAAFRLSGDTSAWLLSTLCGLNFRTGPDTGQHCVRTRLDSVQSILHFHQPGSGAGPFVFDVLVERSLAKHTWNLLLHKIPHGRELQQKHGPYLNTPYS